MTSAKSSAAGEVVDDRRRRRTRVFLVLAILVLLAVLCGVLYTLWTMIKLPERQPVLANKPGVAVEFQTFGGDFGPIKRPLGVAYDRRNDKIYVTEPVSGRVLVFDGQGKKGRIFAQDESREATSERLTLSATSVTSPEGIDVGDDGSVYVADPDKNAVLVFAPDGKRLRFIKVDKPVRVTVVGNRLYILTSPGGLVITDLQGNLLDKFGTWGSALDQLYGPTGVAVDANKNLYITDSQNFRLLGLTPKFKPLWNFGQPGSSEASMSARPIALPTGVALAGDGNLYVVDGLGGKILVFDRAGNPVSAPLSGRGSADNELGLPQTIYWMKDDLFVIADQFHDRVVGFRLTPQPLSGTK